MKLRLMKHLALVATLISLMHKLSLCDPSTQLPERYKSEGKITWTINYGSQRESKELYFTETIDGKLGQASVTIGESLCEANRYVVVHGRETFQVKEHEGCVGYSSGNFVDLINNFANKMFSIDSQISFKPQYQIGPTGLIKILLGLNGQNDLFANAKSVSYRNIDCKVFISNITLQEGVYATFSLYKPTYLDKNDIVNFITFKANSQNSYTNTRTSFIIQIYNFEDIQDASKIKNDFNLPLAQGCSQLLSAYKPHQVDEKFFQMQIKTSKPKESEISIYYDGIAQLLRHDLQMEEHKQSLIWDLNSGFLFGKQFFENPIKTSSNEPVDLENGELDCAIIDTKASGDDLPASLRPYAQRLDALTILGAESISFIGSSNLRGVPTLIYETILDEPPFVFGMGKLELSLFNAKHYLVQFHLMDIYGASENDHSAALNRFWPIQMSLYGFKAAANNDYSEYKLMKLFDIEEFRWNFDGTDFRPGQLFLAPECTEKVANSKYRLEFDLFINECHANPDEQHKNILSQQSAKIEYSLINQIVDVNLNVSRMHLLHYEMQTLQTHLDFDLSLSEFAQPLGVKFMGLGKWDTNSKTISIHEPNEQACLIRGSLSNRVTGVFYCINTKRFTSSRYANCYMILDDDPILVPKQDDDDEDTCYGYSYRYDMVTNSGRDDNMKLNHILDSVNTMIHTKPFKLQLLLPDKRNEIVHARTIDYDVTYEMLPQRVLGYSYNIANSTNPDGKESLFVKSLRTFDTLNTKSRLECETYCHLDGNCHSYSYCNQMTNSTLRKCILSSLDIVESNVNHQLALISPKQKQKVVHDIATDIYFDLLESDSCSIFEHNYLAIYRQTHEFLHVKRELMPQFYTGKTAQECAHKLLHMEEKTQLDPNGQANPSHKLGMFAYCPLAQKCIFREDFINKSLVVDTYHNANNYNVNDDDIMNYNSCQLYRKKYQTYFTMSAQVLKLNSEYQVALEANNLEQCSRACWDRGSRACHSFDFCSSSKQCYVNSIHSSLLKKSDLELRQGCLHYAINPQYDSAQAGRDSADADADAEATQRKRKIGRFFLNSFIIIILMSLGLIAGLSVGIVWHRQIVKNRINRHAREQDEQYSINNNPSTYGTANDQERYSSITSRISLRSILSPRNWYSTSSNLSYQEFNSLNSNYVDSNDRASENSINNDNNIYENVSDQKDGIDMSVITK